MNKVNNDTLEVEGIVIETLPNAMFKVKIAGGGDILAHISGKMRVKYIRVLNGDKVRMEISKYDITKGRITYRLGKNNTGVNK